MTQEDWKAYIEISDDEKDLEMIKKQTMTGRPLGKEEFTRGLEEKFKRRLAVLPKGRPKGIKA